MDEDLHLGVAQLQVAAEVRAEADDAIDVVAAHPLLGFVHGSGDAGPEVRRQLKPRDGVPRIGRRVLDHERNRHVSHIQRQSVAEQQDKDNGQHEADGDAARVAQDLAGFLAHERPDAPELAVETVVTVVHHEDQK